MHDFLTQNDFMDAVLVITSAGMVDPYTPPDGTWNLTGHINVTGDGTFGGDVGITGDLDVGGDVVFTQAVVDAGTPTAFTVTGGAHTDCLTTAEVVDVLFDLGRTVNWATGGITSQSSLKVLAPTLSFDGASTVDVASTVYIDNAPQAGANATLPAAYALNVAAGATLLGGAVKTGGVLDVSAGSWFSGGAQIVFTNIPFRLGSSQETALWFSNLQATQPTLVWGLDDTAKSILLTTNSNLSKDHHVAAQTDPALLLFAADDVDADATKWFKILHDGDKPILSAGTGAITFASSTAHTAGVNSHNDGVPVVFGDSADSHLIYSNVQATAYTDVWGLPATGNSLILTVDANYTKDHDHAQQTNPTLFVHSATDPDSANDEWWSVTHDVTNAVYSVGSGVHSFIGAMTISTTLGVTGNAAFAADIVQTQAIQDAATPTAFTLTAGAHTNCATTVEVTDVSFNLARTVDWVDGAITNQRAFEVLAPTYSTGGASTFTNAATVYIDRAPQQAGSCTITNAYALWVDAGAVRFDGDATIGGQVFIADGTAGAPIIAFTSDTNTGIFYNAGDATLAITQNGGVSAKFQSDLVIISGDLTASTSNSKDVGKPGTTWENGYIGTAIVLGTGDTDDTTTVGGLLRAPDIAVGGAGDVVGSDLTIRPGLGTGVGDVGTIIFETIAVAAAGDNIQTTQTALTLDGLTATFGGDATIGGQVLLGTGQGASAALAFAADTDTGLDLAGAGTMRLIVAGNQQFNVSAGLLIAHSTLRGGVDNTYDSGQAAYTWKDAFIGTSVVLGTGDTDDTTTVGGLLRAPDIATGGAGDVVGADLTIRPGLGTGVGDVGTIIFETIAVAAAGDNIQTTQTALTLDGLTATFGGALTVGGVTTLSAGAENAPSLTFGWGDDGFWGTEDNIRWSLGDQHKGRFNVDGAYFRTDVFPWDTVTQGLGNTSYRWKHGWFGNANDTAAALLHLYQNDLDEPFADFRGTATADAASPISTNTTSGATTHHVRVDINGANAWIAVSTNDPT